MSLRPFVPYLLKKKQATLEMLASITIFSTILLAKERRRYDEIS